jgi:hypothetical protein
LIWKIQVLYWPQHFQNVRVEKNRERKGMEKIDHLRKVSLLLDEGGQATPFEFIFGIGPEGLSPFEFELAGKKEGDVVALQMRGEDVPHTFQHLMFPELDKFERKESFLLKAHVEKVSPADQKEVIKAMAEMASCGEHCCGH